MVIWAAMKGIDDELASALFWLARRVRDVAYRPPDGTIPWREASVVRAAAAGVSEISADLLVLAQQKLDADGRLDAAAIACQRIAKWAAGQGMREVALNFAGSAVALLPLSARRAYEAGRLHRILGAVDEAEVLYSRAVSLTRRQQSRVYVRGHLGLGHIHNGRGDLEGAAAHFAAAARAAAKAGEKWLAGLTEHDLFLLAVEKEDYDAALAHAINAFEWLGPHHEQVPWLGHDFCFMLVQLRAYGLAMPLLETVMAKDLSPAYMVIGWSTLARTAAALGNVARFHDAEANVRKLAEHFQLHASAAYVNLAIGAHQLGLSSAEADAQMGFDLARQRKELFVLSVAEPLLESVRRGERPEPVAIPELPPAVVEFSRSLAVRLRKWRGSTWRRKRQSGRADVGDV